MGVNLEGEMHACQGCSMANGLLISIPKKTDNRASKLSEEEEGVESDHEDREASSKGSGSASGYEESEPDESEEDEVESSTTVTVASGRAPLPTSSTDSSQGGVS